METRFEEIGDLTFTLSHFTLSHFIFRRLIPVKKDSLVIMIKHAFDTSGLIKISEFLVEYLYNFYTWTIMKHVCLLFVCLSVCLFTCIYFSPSHLFAVNRNLIINTCTMSLIYAAWGLTSFYNDLPKGFFVRFALHVAFSKHSTVWVKKGNRDSILNLSKSKRQIIKLLSVEDSIFIFSFIWYIHVHWSFILGQGRLLSK